MSFYSTMEVIKFKVEDEVENYSHLARVLIHLYGTN